MVCRKLIHEPFDLVGTVSWCLITRSHLEKTAVILHMIATIALVYETCTIIGLIHKRTLEHAFLMLV